MGLGNPGKGYDRTRHNLGFAILRAFAARHGFVFKRQAQVEGEMAHGMIGETKVYLLMPQTYMNLSGQSVQKCLNYYKLSPQDMIVVSDDVALPFGKYRKRDEGGAGGHNGLKSIESSVQTKSYPRLRVGIGDREQGDLSDFVLGKFTKEEEDKLPEILDEGVALLENWLGETNEK